MRKLLTKYIVLLVVTFAASILIYNYVEASSSIETENDLLSVQNEKENNYLLKTNYSIDDPMVILNPYGTSPLTALVVFQTKDLTTTTVTIKGKNGNDLVHTFTPAKIHILPIYGLYPEYDNKIVIQASGKTKELTIKTEKLPDDFAKVTHVNKNDFETDEFYFTTPEDKGYTAAYDVYGEVRWYIIGDYKWDIQRLSNGHILMSSDKTISGSYSVGLMEMDLLGKVYFEYAVPGGYHHNVYELNNGNLLLASNNFESNTVEDYIVEIDRNSGNIIKTIDLNEALKNKNKGNWFKITSLVYDRNTNSITVSGYNSNMLVNIDYSSLNVNWVIGEKVNDDIQNLVLKNNDNSSYPTNPESINLLNDQMIFVNTIDGERYLTTYKIDYSNRTFTETYKYRLGGDKHSYLEVLSSDDYVVSQGNAIKEIIKGKESISFDVNSLLYNTKRMPFYANDIYTGVKGVRLGTLGVSKPSRDYLLFSVKNKDISKKYSISLYKDVYGLKVKGSFSKDDKVQIILDNVLDKKTYELKINDNGVSSRYINEEGIKGKYYIFLRINGKIYKLYKYVIFK